MNILLVLLFLGANPPFFVINPTDVFAMSLCFSLPFLNSTQLMSFWCAGI